MNNLKVLRAKKDVSQQQLSQVLGVSQNTISSWETSSTRPSAKNMLKISTSGERRLYQRIAIL